MVDANKIIEDIIKGAQQTEGFMRGSAMGIERQTLGEETKLAGDHAGLGAALGPIGAAIGAESGHRGDAALGSLGGGLAGGVAGGGAGALIGLLARNPGLAAGLGIGGAGLGALAGSIYGAHRGGRSGVDRLRDKLSADNALPAAYFIGVKEACDHFKVAFAGLLPAVAGLATKAAPLATKALANPTVRSLGTQAAGGAAMQAGMNAMAPKQPQ